MSEGCGAVPKSESQVRPNLTSHKYSTNVFDEGGDYAAQAGVPIVKVTGFFAIDMLLTTRTPAPSSRFKSAEN